MKRVGNVASNRIYNPQNTRPPLPFDADEADSAMERFIRQKYQERTVSAPARHNTGSTNSDDHPPPLPPKTGSRFGFRSASSIFPLSSKSRRQAAAAAAQSEFEQRNRSPSPGRMNKPSKVFGTSVGSDDFHDMDKKLSQLREMGFRDEKRNETVLKGLKGNLEKSIESLVRLGEGNSSGGLKHDSGPSSRSRTPISGSAGLTVNRTLEREQSKSSNNPFDALESPVQPLQPQSSQSTGSLLPNQMGSNQYQQPSSNPFGFMPSQSQYSLNQAFQTMASSSSQPLFPNHTGGFPAHQQAQIQQMYQQSMTPPVPSVPQQHYPPVIYENPAQQPQHNYNPFMQEQQQIPPISTNFQPTFYTQALSAPVARTQTFFNSPVEQSSMQQQGQQAIYANGFHQQAQVRPQQQTIQTQQSNPFFQNSQQHDSQPRITQQLQQAPQQSYDFQGQQQAQFQSQRQQTFPLIPQKTGRADKRSILDLYNYPHLAPTPLQQQQSQSEIHNANAAMDAPQQQRSASNPVAAPMAGSRNPFIISGGSGVQSPADPGRGQYAPQNGARHVSQESMTVDTGGWNGRHSPDAWGTISSRSVI